MARQSMKKVSVIERDRKIKKLTKMIKAKERELDIIEAKAERAKAQVASGDISKGDYQRLNITMSRNRKAVRGAITRIEGTRLNRERKLKQVAIDKKEKEDIRKERQEERAREKSAKNDEGSTED